MSVNLQSSSFSCRFGVHTKTDPDPWESGSGSEVEWYEDSGGISTWNSDPIRIAGSAMNTINLYYTRLCDYACMCSHTYYCMDSDYKGLITEILQLWCRLQREEGWVSGRTSSYLDSIGLEEVS